MFVVEADDLKDPTGVRTWNALNPYGTVEIGSQMERLETKRSTSHPEWRAQVREGGVHTRSCSWIDAVCDVGHLHGGEADDHSVQRGRAAL